MLYKLNDKVITHKAKLSIFASPYHSTGRLQLNLQQNLINNIVVGAISQGGLEKSGMFGLGPWKKKSYPMEVLLAKKLINACASTTNDPLCTESYNKTSSDHAIFRGSRFDLILNLSTLHLDNGYNAYAPHELNPERMTLLHVFERKGVDDIIFVIGSPTRPELGQLRIEITSKDWAKKEFTEDVWKRVISVL